MAKVTFLREAAASPGRRVAPTKDQSAMPATSLVATSGHRPAFSEVCDRATLASPSAAPPPAAIARTLLDVRSSAGPGDVAPPTRATARTATATPVSATPPGRSPDASPITVGTTAATTATVGAATFIGPIASER